VESGHGYDFNKSLFERLIDEGMEPAKLVLQYRMRPEISRPVRELMYKELQDADTVQGRSAFRGVQANAFFVSHALPEGGDTQAGTQSMDSMSKTNHAEACLAVRIVQHCLLQGYAPSEIVVLTPYLGQLSWLRNGLQVTRLAAIIGSRDMDDLVDHGFANPVQFLTPRFDC
jgi:superfamily I DNA and/or RNA helicase